MIKRKFTEQSWNKKHGKEWKLIAEEEEEEKAVYIKYPIQISPLPLNEAVVKDMVLSFSIFMSIRAAANNLQMGVTVPQSHRPEVLTLPSFITESHRKYLVAYPINCK